MAQKLVPRAQLADEGFIIRNTIGMCAHWLCILYGNEGLGGGSIEWLLTRTSRVEEPNTLFGKILRVMRELRWALHRRATALQCFKTAFTLTDIPLPDDPASDRTLPALRMHQSERQRVGGMDAWRDSSGLCLCGD